MGAGGIMMTEENSNRYGSAKILGQYICAGKPKIEQIGSLGDTMYITLNGVGYSVVNGELYGPIDYDSLSAVRAKIAANKIIQKE